jgi:hypothetical protein
MLRKTHPLGYCTWPMCADARVPETPLYVYDTCVVLVWSCVIRRYKTTIRRSYENYTGKPPVSYEDHTCMIRTVYLFDTGCWPHMITG